MYGLLFGFLALFGMATVSPALAQVPDVEGGFNTNVQNTEYNPNTIGADGFKEDSLIKIIKNAINWILGLLGLIALGLCLYAGFLMTTAGGDTKKFDEGKLILKNAGIGLAIIALSWMIVSLIFRIIEKVAGGGTGA